MHKLTEAETMKFSPWLIKLSTSVVAEQYMQGRPQPTYFIPDVSTRDTLDSLLGNTRQVGTYGCALTYGINSIVSWFPNN
jgi:hypothetical protein